MYVYTPIYRERVCVCVLTYICAYVCHKCNATKLFSCGSGVEPLPSCLAYETRTLKPWPAAAAVAAALFALEYCFNYLRSCDLCLNGTSGQRRGQDQSSE